MLLLELYFKDNGTPLSPPPLLPGDQTLLLILFHESHNNDTFLKTKYLFTILYLNSKLKYNTKHVNKIKNKI